MTEAAAVEVLPPDTEADRIIQGNAVLLENDDNELDDISDDVYRVNPDDVVEDNEENRAHLDMVKQRLRNIENEFWELCRDIAIVCNDKLYKILGFTHFKDYLQSELDMSRRKGYYYVRIHNYFTDILPGILADKPELLAQFIEHVKAMGWSKAARIASDQPITRDNAESVIKALTTPAEDGKMLSYRHMEKLIKKEKEKLTQADCEDIEEKNDEAQKFHNMRFAFTLPQANDVKNALEHAKRIANVGTKDSTLLSWVCRDYLAQHMGATQKDEILHETMARYEGITQLDIVVFDRQKGEVLYGKDNLPFVPK